MCVTGKTDVIIDTRYASLMNLFKLTPFICGDRTIPVVTWITAKPYFVLIYQDAQYTNNGSRLMDIAQAARCHLLSHFTYSMHHTGNRTSFCTLSHISCLSNQVCTSPHFTPLQFATLHINFTTPLL